MGKETPNSQNSVQELAANEELEQFRDEVKDLAEDITIDYVPTRKEVHRTFCEYASEILSPEEQSTINDMF